METIGYFFAAGCKDDRRGLRSNNEPEDVEDIEEVEEEEEEEGDEGVESTRGFDSNDFLRRETRESLRGGV